MIVEQVKKDLFYPVTITLETKQEFLVLKSLVGSCSPVHGEMINGVTEPLYYALDNICADDGFYFKPIELSGKELVNAYRNC